MSAAILTILQQPQPLQHLVKINNMSNRKDLKAFVRYDGTGRIVPSSLILARKMPKVGDWKQIQAYECCDPNFPTTTTTSTSTPT